jgi:hypothetical protein
MAYTQKPIPLEVELSNDEPTAANVVAFERFWEMVFDRLLNETMLNETLREREAA